MAWTPDLKMGRLGVVYDQAGKARIVAITNWWIQLVLKPIHNSLFDLLGQIEMDGTFDQERPLNLLVSRVAPGQKFHSFDLSAATDRIPIDVQIQVLNSLEKGRLGTVWGRLLDIRWFVH